LLLGSLLRLVANYILQEITTVAILLQDESTCHTWTETMDLDIFKPDMTIRHEVRVGEGGKKLDLDKDLFQPGVIVSDGNSLAGKVAQSTTIDFMADQQHNPLAAAA
jgi:hypothetical protein